MTKIAYFLTPVLALIAAAPAQAATYVFTVGGSATGSGTLTTNSAPTGSGSTLITGITGTLNGAAITGLLAPGAYGGNDNLLFANATPQLDFNGFAFTFGNLTANIFYNDALPSYRLLTNGAPTSNITFSAVASGVPEAATWAMMLVGFAMIGTATRYRRRKTSVSFA